MKNYIKKLITLFVFAFLFTGSSVFASVSWNTDPTDCNPASAVGNVTTNTGIPPAGSNNCWTLTSVNANPGNIVNVQLYYHNTGTQPATNTKLFISVSPAVGQVSTVHTFTSNLTSDQGNKFLGTTQIVLPTAQALNFGTTVWHANQGANNSTTPAQVITSPSGLSLGTINQGWAAQGATVTSFTVGSSTPSVCSISNFTANPTQINSGGSSSLSWNTSNCTSATIYPTIGNVNNVSGGSQTVSNITASTMYTMTAYGAGGSQDTKTVTVNVTQPQACSISNFTANGSSGSTTIQSGGSAAFAWSTSNCTSATIYPTIGNVYNYQNGTQTVTNITASTVYTMTAYGAGGSQDTKTVTVNVTPTPVCSISNFTANPTSITSGSSSTLTWNTNNCTSVSISNLNYTVPVSGSQAVYPTYTTTYTLTAYGQTGTQQTQSVTVVVNQQQICSITNFSASPTYINSGNFSVLTWNTNNCTSVSISNLNYNVPVSGSQAVYPTVTTTYVLTAYGQTGTQQTQSVTVNVNNYQNNTCTISSFYASPNSINSGNSSVLYWATNNCTSVNISPNIGTVYNYQSGYQTVYPSYTTTYTLTAYGNNGSVTQSATVNVNNYQNNTCTISSFYASPTSVNYGGASNLTWSTSGNCTSASISNIGNVNAYSGSQYVYPTYTTTYTLTVYGSGYWNSQDSRSVTVYVNNYVQPPTPIYNTCAVTSVATNITQNSATLNGLVTNSGSYTGNTYFEYGTDVTLGLQTSARSIGSNTTFNEFLTGLSPKTIYYYRLVSNCNNTISRGSIEFFQTAGNTTVTNTTTIIRQGTTVIGTESPIMLKIENRYQSIGVGDMIDYTITYKNISKRTLTNPVLQVVLPKGVAFLKASRGTYSTDTYTLTVPLEDLVYNIEGTVYVQGRVDSINTGNAQIVTTAILVYTSKNGAQENAIAYVLNNPVFVSSGFGLGALALFGSFFGMGIIGWMILLILILLAILLFRKVYRKN